MLKIRYRELKGYKYELMEKYFHDTGIIPPAPILTEYIYLGLNGELAIRERYAWDGASGPTFDTKSSQRASLVHDSLYQLLSLGLLGQEHRQRADELLRDIAIADGMWRWRAWAWYYAVRAVASKYALPDGQTGENPVLEAP